MAQRNRRAAWTASRSDTVVPCIHHRTETGCHQRDTTGIARDMALGMLSTPDALFGVYGLCFMGSSHGPGPLRSGVDELDQVLDADLW